MENQQIVLIVAMEDEPLHTDGRPECDDLACSCHKSLKVGDRVRVLVANRDGTYHDGTIYRHLPSRPHPWHVRPDGWPSDVAGISYSASELEKIS
jgi:hypothetical protein